MTKLKYPKLNILIAYPYFKENVVELLNTLPKNSYRLIVDSGAFTAWNTGKIINLDDYCKFLEALAKRFDYHAVQLDVFGEPEKSWQNYLTMKERGFDTMPVFTRGESLERLEEMYSHTDYIMFGGIVFGGKNREYVKWFLEKNKGRKAHWLGFVKPAFIKSYKPESVDSSSWCSGVRFGHVDFYSGVGKLKTFDKKLFAKKPTDEMITLFRKTGLPLRLLKTLGQNEAWRSWRTSDFEFKSNNVKGTSQYINTLSHLLRMVDVEQNVGTKIYLAAGSKDMLLYLIKGYEHLILKGKIKCVQ